MNPLPEILIELNPPSAIDPPGSEVRGMASWRGVSKIKSASIHLYWSATSEGNEDVEIVQTIHFDQPNLSDQREFHFTLPEGPLSFSGQLISLSWGLELVVSPGHSTRVPLNVCGKDGPISLPSIKVKPQTRSWFQKWMDWNR